MKRVRKGRIVLVILFTIIIISVATVAIMYFLKKAPQKPQEQEKPVEEETVIPLPETTYSNMEVKNITVEYMKNNNQTKLSMEIHNTSKRKVEDEYFNAVLIGNNEETIGQMRTWIQTLDIGEQYDFEVILEGDLTATKQVKLIEE